MTRFRGIAAILVMSSVAFTTLSPAQESKVLLPNDFTLELLGRCLLYSLSYQRTITPHFGIELGGSLLGGSGASVAFISVGGRLYAVKGNASPCVAGGVVLVSGSTSSGPFDNSTSTSYGYIGPGFEYRSDGGFIFRGTVYFLIRDGFFVWPGLQIGIAF